MALFDIRDLHKTYENGDLQTKVLHGLTFTIERGEFVSVTGPSGSGKSTLLHILGFLDDLTSGSYTFEGKSYGEYTDDERARVRNKEMGFVFQQFNLLPRQTVYENVRLPLTYSTIPERAWDARVREVVELVGLTPRIDFPIYRLSGGEQQRTAIARALINKPHVIFADEPTGNLDTASGKIVMETLRRLHDEFGHTVILITHETTTAEYADRIIQILDGRIASDRPMDRSDLMKNGYKK